MAGEHILVVDDDNTIRNFIAGTVLSLEGYAAYQAESGEKGLETAKKIKPDLVISDYDMPGINGLDMIEEMRKAGLRMPAILITAEGSERIALRALRLGVMDYFIKPFDTDNLVEAVRRILDSAAVGGVRTSVADQKYLQTVNTLSGIAKSITAMLDLETILAQVTDAAVSFSGADECLIMLHDPHSQEMTLRASKNVREGFRTLRLNVNDSYAGQVIATGEPVYVSGEGAKKIKTQYLVQSLLYVPLKVPDRGTIGVLGLHGNEHPLQLDTLNIDLINALADYGGIAIGNAMMVSQLRELDRMKSEFVTSVSHDLRSPLTAILSYIELLERVGELNEMQRTFVGNVRSSVASITSLVNDLLALTRIEAGMDKEREPIRLSRVARPCVEDLRGRASVKGQTLSISVEDTEVPVYANPVRIRQVFNNLIDNAIKYTPEGGKISVHIRGAEGQVIIEVKDDGIGIPSEAQPHIFERFYRVKEVANSYDGTGLGLNIVSTIIQSYDGRIWVESLPAQGTTFTIMLPAYIEEKVPA